MTNILDSKSLKGRSGNYEKEGKSFFPTRTNTFSSPNSLPKSVTKNRFRQPQTYPGNNENVDCDFYTSDICLEVSSYPEYVKFFQNIHHFLIYYNWLEGNILISLLFFLLAIGVKY